MNRGKTITQDEYNTICWDRMARGLKPFNQHHYDHERRGWTLVFAEDEFTAFLPAPYLLSPLTTPFAR